MDNEGDTWVNWIIEEMCGVSDQTRLTMRILESHLEELLFELDDLKKVIDRTDDGYATIAIGAFLKENQTFLLFLIF